ncbi:Exocyst complex component SEC8 [Camellia lanceoleosa]|uniref:Exocyst complex component SEC8 n=1 Tax=Camellia lanceoleosa TaxID=1840588 RepID=A0ACC0HXS5_9ERIC|nr:Exocyst complex component SEC8 [Camellia lanceoleosa]
MSIWILAKNTLLLIRFLSEIRFLDLLYKPVVLGKEEREESSLSGLKMRNSWGFLAAPKPNISTRIHRLVKTFKNFSQLFAQAAAKELLNSILDAVVRIFENHVIVGELLESKSSQQILQATPEAASADAAVHTARLANKAPSKEKRQETKSVEIQFVLNCPRSIFLKLPIVDSILTFWIVIC